MVGRGAPMWAPLIYYLPLQKQNDANVVEFI